MTNSKRIGWIDLAKGFCIMLVVFHHVSSVLGVDYPFSVQARGFRMPLYFILSGLFFKQYEGFDGFLKRKTNKLLIPFLFFLASTLVLPSLLLHHDTSLGMFFQDRVIIYNDPIWFLLCLFEVNLLFYLVQWVAEKISIEHKSVLTIVMALLLGINGLVLGALQLRLPLYFDSALSALPLFAFGWWFFRHTAFLPSPVNYVRDGAIALTGLIVLWLFAVPVKWINNEFSWEAMPVVYLCGIGGTMMVLIVSKMIGRLLVISYWGRYSIIILCTHYPVAMIFERIFGRYLSGGLLVAVVFVMTMVVCWLLIPLMKRFLPHVTAQKDVIKVGA
jgi:fucose 4-O-acetylase-like acetyltransferase